MKEPTWVRRDVVLAFHERLLAEHGGTPGIRDAGLLESALKRPEDLFAYGAPSSLFALVASYAFGLVKNHLFFDGNKRIGFTSAALLLALNGIRFAASEPEVVQHTLALAAGETSETSYAEWMTANSIVE